MKLIKSTMSRQEIVDRFEIFLPAIFLVGVLVGFAIATFILK